jgi:DME family drug/metabolite transporter
MRPEIIAIISAMGWAGDAVLVRIGARSSNIIAAAFMSYFVAALWLWVYLFIYVPFDVLRSRASIYFLLSGCLQPLLARILYYIGITRIGVSRAGPLRGSEPLLSVVLAVIFLHEDPNEFVYAGTFLIIASVWLILWRRSGEAAWNLFDIVFPLGAAFCGAVSQNLRKAGLLLLPDPYVGAAIGTSTSLFLFWAFLLATGRFRLARPNRKSLPFFAGAAVISAVAQIMNFAALSRGEVSAMVPLFNTTPLFAVLFSAIFLRDVEKVTLKVVLGAILMVAGVVIIAAR